MPLFTNVEDVMTSWERLKTEAGSTANGPTIQVGESERQSDVRFLRVSMTCPTTYSLALPLQVSTIGAIVDMMEKGGADIRQEQQWGFL